MHSTKIQIHLPYRVIVLSINSKGELAGEFVFGGPGVQASRLAAEGVMSEDGKIDLKKYGMTLMKGRQ